MSDRRAVLFASLGAALGALIAPGAARAAGGADKRLTSAESYVPIHGLSATVMADFSPVGLLMVDFGVDVPDEALRSRAQRMTPRLRDAGRAALAEYCFSRLRPGAAPDADQIARMLQRNVDQTLGAQGAKVLLANVMTQRARR